jgi:ssDNA-binding Zn-finger/Zn-ribbon topoisomerase 1
MSPLKVETECLKCHAKHGYKLGDIRGGISVSFPYSPFQKAININNKQILAVHAIFFLSSLTIVYLLGKNLMATIQELQESMNHIKRLEGLLPICANCKKIGEGNLDRSKQTWLPIEEYIQKQTDAKFTHGICPECTKKLYPEIADKLL